MVTMGDLLKPLSTKGFEMKVGNVQGSLLRFTGGLKDFKDVMFFRINPQWTQNINSVNSAYNDLNGGLIKQMSSVKYKPKIPKLLTAIK